MSEQLPDRPEMGEQQRAEQLDEHERPERAPESTHEQSEKLPDIETIGAKAHQEARSRSELADKVKPEVNAKEQLYVNKELKNEAFQRALNRTRKHLSAPDRGLSKAIHQPVIDAISKAAEKTIVRPTGVLTGSIVALVGSSYVLYTAKHYGFTYNYLIVFVLFVGGYVVGLLLEIVLFFIHRLRGSQ